MSFNASRLVHPALLQLKPYQPGKPIAECQRELGLTHIIKLASNENPLGTSPYVIANLLSEMNNLARYPDGGGFELKQALSKHLKVASDELILGNGSEDVLRMMLQTFVFGDLHIIIPQYAFIAYGILAKGLGLGVVEVKAQDFTADLPAMLKAINHKTRMIILANPNNPTGTYVTENALKEFMEKVPDNVIVVCDEAYYEYIHEKDYPQTLTWFKKYPNFMITRTFSKAYGLAGLRLGYGIAHPEVIELVNRLRQPFNVNHLAQVAGCLALEDQAFVQKGIALNERGKIQLEKGFTQLGIKYIPSAGNFIMVHLKNDKDIYQEMLKRGVIIRPLAPYQLADYFRITVGTEEENEMCLTALKQVLTGEK
ncbi:MAG: histidinol-phosphate transaminase [Candidatus Berkiellales bacterium]